MNDTSVRPIILTSLRCQLPTTIFISLFVALYELIPDDDDDDDGKLLYSKKSFCVAAAKEKVVKIFTIQRERHN